MALSPSRPSQENQNEDLVVDSRGRKLSNLKVLYITALLFCVFVAAEIIGALVSGSLALLGDATAMMVDTLSYLFNILVERQHTTGKKLDPRLHYYLDICVPAISVMMLIGVSVYIIVEAAQVIKYRKGQSDDEVNPAFLYAYSSANLLVDIISSSLFYYLGKDALLQDPVETTDEHIRQSRASRVSRTSELAKEICFYRSPSTEGTFRNEFFVSGIGESHNTHNSVDATIHHNPIHTQQNDHAHANNHNRHPQDKNDDNDLTYSNISHNVDGKAPDQLAHSHPNNNKTNNDDDKQSHNHDDDDDRSKRQDNPANARIINLNMMSALTHVGGDTLRTIAVFAAAVIATCGVNSSLVDAYAALVVCCTIILAVLPLCNEIYKVAIRDIGDLG